MRGCGLGAGRCGDGVRLGLCTVRFSPLFSLLLAAWPPRRRRALERNGQGRAALRSPGPPSGEHSAGAAAAHLCSVPPVYPPRRSGADSVALRARPYRRSPSRRTGRSRGAACGAPGWALPAAEPTRSAALPAPPGWRARLGSGRAGRYRLSES